MKENKNRLCGSCYLIITRFWFHQRSFCTENKNSQRSYAHSNLENSIHKFLTIKIYIYENVFFERRLIFIIFSLFFLPSTFSKCTHCFINHIMIVPNQWNFAERKMLMNKALTRQLRLQLFLIYLTVRI